MYEALYFGGPYHGQVKSSYNQSLEFPVFKDDHPIVTDDPFQEYNILICAYRLRELYLNAVDATYLWYVGFIEKVEFPEIQETFLRQYFSWIILASWMTSQPPWPGVTTKRISRRNGEWDSRSANRDSATETDRLEE